MLDLTSIRARNRSLLAARGFRVAENLPLRGEHETDPRPRAEIVRRLAALNAVFVYVSGSEDRFPQATLLQMIGDHDLRAAMSRAEQDILDLPREDAREDHRGTSGWLTENMLPLAWALGHAHEPTIDGAMLDRPAIRTLCMSFAPVTAAACASLLEAKTLRPAAEIVALEDLFHCCHNAVRSAQFDDPSCVPDFDPVAAGGVIHERRHALTWMLSPGVEWDETDLST